MKNRLLLSILFTLAYLCGFGQQKQEKYVLSGFVKDKESGEILSGANLYVVEADFNTSTNSYGYYSISLPKGSYTVELGFVGYEDLSFKIDLQSNIKKDIVLANSSQELQEVTVSRRTNKNVTSTEMSAQRLEVKEIRSIPVLFGEQDIIKTIQLMPGVKSGGEGGTGFYVRGGGVDQNLVLLDEASVYNASHLLGFFSVFNSDAIRDLKLYKGGMPASYGGRLSSVLDVKMREGNTNEWKVNGGIGTISSRLMIEAPIKKGKSSFLVAARRTYADAFLVFSSDTMLNKTSLYFYDINAKANFQLNEKNKLFVSGYFGRDVMAYGTVFGNDWGNSTGTVRWNKVFGEKLFANTSAIFSDFLYKIHFAFDPGKLTTIGTGIRDVQVRSDFNWYPNTNNNVEFGMNAIHHTFNMGELESESDFFNTKKLPQKRAAEIGAYILNDQKITHWISANYGLRLSSFTALGPWDVFDKNNNKTSYATNEKVTSYLELEPRLALTYRVKEDISLKGSYSRNVQYLHLLQSSSSSSPSDTWMPAGPNVRPMSSNQVAVGVFKNLEQNMFETSVELYYKTMNNLLDYKSDGQMFLNERVDTMLYQGIGKAYGIEFLVRKQTGKLTGWVGYTLSRSLRQFDEIRNGEWYSAKQDRIHDISVVAIYKLTKRIDLSGTWIYSTGDAVTLPKGRYPLNPAQTRADGNTGRQINVIYYGPRNGSRMPAYHRMDLSLNIHGNPAKRFRSNWNFSIYNVYSNKNPYTINFNTNEAKSTMVYLFPILPSVTWNFEF